MILKKRVQKRVQKRARKRVQKQVQKPRRWGAALAVALASSAVLLPPLATAPPAAAAERRKVVTAFYPLAWVAVQVGGDRVAVANLTPAGAEPHDLELTPDQMDALLDADVAIVMGKDFQPAVERAAEQRDGVTVRLLDRLPTRAGDPHVWLDPVLMRRIVARVRTALVKADPAGKVAYERHAAGLDTRLVALDQRYRDGLSSCARDEIVTAHEAFGYLARRYGLRQEGVAGLAPDAEPDAQRLGQLADLVKRDGVTTVFTESLLSPRIADTLAREAGVRTAVLNPLEGLTDRERARGDDYVSVMNANLVELRAALGCT